jgi:cytochrome c biogenesis protein CcdA
MEVEMENTNYSRIYPAPAKKPVPGVNHSSKAEVHACKVSLRGYREARDHLKRAERDLGETAAFIAASLTTVTAIQAVITVARDKLELSKDVLQLAFQGYVALFLLILFLGALRVGHAIRRRTQAEKEIDQTRKGIFEFCDPDQWNKTEEKE